MPKWKVVKKFYQREEEYCVSPAVMEYQKSDGIEDDFLKFLKNIYGKRKVNHNTTGKCSLFSFLLFLISFATIANFMSCIHNSELTVCAYLRMLTQMCSKHFKLAHYHTGIRLKWSSGIYLLRPRREMRDLVTLVILSNLRFFIFGEQKVFWEFMLYKANIFVDCSSQEVRSYHTGSNILKIRK